MKCFLSAALIAVGLSSLGLLTTSSSAQPAKGADAAQSAQWNAVVGKALAYLKGAQEANGGWSTQKNIGVTGIVVTGMLQTGKVTPKDPMADKGLKFIESLINPKAGHIAGADPKAQLQNYVTSINVMALVAAKRDDYKAVIGDAVKFLKKLQWDEDDGKNKDSDFYGGAGYDSKSRPDLSNTQMFLDALKASGLSKDDPAYQKALIFVSRCQNLKSEVNNLPWAGKINDGSFIYTAATGGATKVIDEPMADGSLPGYGSMTYAGIKSMIYCGVDPKDERVKKAYEWIQKHYTVDKNPGMPEPRSQWGLYYYYHTMAKALDALGVDEVIDIKGQKHNWRQDIVGALAKRQAADGSFSNVANWMEADPNLVTGYALMALSLCKPKE